MANRRAVALLLKEIIEDDVTEDGPYEKLCREEIGELHVGLHADRGLNVPGDRSFACSRTAECLQYIWMRKYDKHF